MKLKTALAIGAAASIPLGVAGWIIVRTIVLLFFYFLGAMFADEAIKVITSAA